MAYPKGKAKSAPGTTRRELVARAKAEGKSYRQWKDYLPFESHAEPTINRRPASGRVVRYGARNFVSTGPRGTVIAPEAEIDNERSRSGPEVHERSGTNNNRDAATQRSTDSDESEQGDGEETSHDADEEEEMEEDEEE